MNRKHFIKTSALYGLGILAAPNILNALNLQTSLPYPELIGKGHPILKGNTYKLRQEAYEAFKHMREAALLDGIDLKIVSSYRSFDHQNRIWERKFNSYISKGMDAVSSIKKIIEYSTIPGTSRHHWGTDLDLIDGSVSQPKSVLVPSHFDINGCFSRMKLWMDQHSDTFGFYLVYTDTTDRKGFKYEPWHYSYKPLSKAYLKDYQKLNLRSILSKERLLGHEHFSDEFLRQYLNENILSINSELL